MRSPVLRVLAYLAALTSLLQIAVNQALVFVTPIADLIVIELGVAMLFGANPC